jgi:hypothetical protein
MAIICLDIGMFPPYSLYLDRGYDVANVVMERHVSVPGHCSALKPLKIPSNQLASIHVSQKSFVAQGVRAATAQSVSISPEMTRRNRRNRYAFAVR